MARTNSLANYLTDVADAIRTKKGDNSLISADSFDTEILNLPSGGGAIEKKDVNFYDYDGTLTNSYTKEEFLALESMPSNPTHEGLISKGWNWTLQEAKTYLLTEDFVEIGQVYNTDDDKTRIYVTIGENQLKPSVGICVNGTAYIDWGDNTTPDTLTYANLNYVVRISHTYASVGDYVIKISLAENSMVSFKGDSSSTGTLFCNSNNNYDYSYGACVNKIEVGKNCQLHEYAFRYFINMKSITLPDDFIRTTAGGVNSTAFGFCINLKHVTLPRSLDSIPNSTFYNTLNLESVSIAPTTTTIGSSMFTNCPYLQRVSMPNSITSFSSSAFQSRGIKKAHIPNQITTIPRSTCYQSNIEKINIPSGVTSIESSAFSMCPFLKNITLPSSVTTLGDSAFGDCYNLKEITFPSGITAISSSCCYLNYSLEKAIFLGDITSIGNSAFRNCGALKLMDFTHCTSVPTAGGSYFISGLSTDCKIVVPDSLYDTWIATQYWSTNSIKTRIVKESEYNA